MFVSGAAEDRSLARGHSTRCEWRMIRLAGAAEWADYIGKYFNSRSNISSLSRARH